MEPLIKTTIPVNHPTIRSLRNKSAAWCEWCGDPVDVQLSKVKVCSLPCAEALVDDARNRKVDAREFNRYVQKRDRIRMAMGIPVAHKPKALRPLFVGAGIGR